MHSLDNLTVNHEKNFVNSLKNRQKFVIVTNSVIYEKLGYFRHTDSYLRITNVSEI